MSIEACSGARFQLGWADESARELPGERLVAHLERMRARRCTPMRVSVGSPSTLPKGPAGEPMRVGGARDAQSGG